MEGKITPEEYERMFGEPPPGFEKIQPGSAQPVADPAEGADDRVGDAYREWRDHLDRPYWDPPGWFVIFQAGWQASRAAAAAELEVMADRIAVNLGNSRGVVPQNNKPLQAKFEALREAARAVRATDGEGNDD